MNRTDDFVDAIHNDAAWVQEEIERQAEEARKEEPHNRWLDEKRDPHAEAWGY